MSPRPKKASNKENSQGLKDIHTAMGWVEADVIKSYLESNGIKCVFKGSGAQSILPQTTDGMGQIKIYVMEDDAALAKKLLKEYRESAK